MLCLLYLDECVYLLSDLAVSKQQVNGHHNYIKEVLVVLLLDFVQLFDGLEDLVKAKVHKLIALPLELLVTNEDPVV